jgi:glucose dehydrogenase
LEEVRLPARERAALLVQLAVSRLLSPLWIPLTSAITMLDPASGELKKRVDLPYPNYSGVLSTAGGVVFSGQLTGEFEAFDANDGKKLWQFQTGSGIEGQPGVF